MKVHSFRRHARNDVRGHSGGSVRTIARSFVAFALLLPLIILLPATADAQSTCRGKAVTINMNTNGGNGNGTPGNDVILGTSGSETIRGYGGVDTICAGGGNDIIYGDGGSDRIRGEGGHDKIYAGSGADDVWGGPGNDTIYGHGGQDDIWGEDGDDYIQGNHQSDKLYGGNGNDTVAGADGQDLIYGDAGDDILRGGNNSDQLFGGPGIDNLNGQSGSDTLTGGPGNDTCVNGTPIDCYEAPSGPIAPAWVGGAQISLQDFNLDDFTISWGSTTGAPTELEATVHDSNGVLETYTINLPASSFKFDWFNGGRLQPSDQYWVSLVLKKSGGQSSTPIEFGPVGFVDFDGNTGATNTAFVASAAATTGTTDRTCWTQPAQDWSFFGHSSATIGGGAIGSICSSVENGNVSMTAFAQVGGGVALQTEQARTVKLHQQLGLADWTIDISEDSGWKRTVAYVNPPNRQAYDCPDSFSSIFVDFRYKTEAGMLTVTDIVLTNGASRTDAVRVGGGMARGLASTSLDGWDKLTGTAIIAPASRKYVVDGVVPGPGGDDLISILTSDPDRPHVNGGQNSIIKFHLTSEVGGASCAPVIILRLE